uniref:Uncharacterized protein n=1 Tax=viral metagenome TaxID=1070528 RepID=A0A6C0CHL4_9ZZZZ
MDMELDEYIAPVFTPSVDIVHFDNFDILLKLWKDGGNVVNLNKITLLSLFFNSLLPGLEKVEYVKPKTVTKKMMADTIYNFNKFLDLCMRDWFHSSLDNKNTLLQRLKEQLHKTTIVPHVRYVLKLNNTERSKLLNMLENEY